MSKTINFQRSFTNWGDKTREFERSNEIQEILTTLIDDLSMTIGAFIDGKFSSIWLHEGDATGDKADLDLIFVNQTDQFLDVILREDGVPVYGGFLNPSVKVLVTDEVVDGHRVIIGIDENGGETRHEAIGGFYSAVGPTAAVSLKSPARAKMRRTNKQ